MASALQSAPLEKFCAALRKLHCGSVDSLKSTRVVHPHRDKLILVTGLISEFSIQAAMCILVDVWEGCYSKFYAFCKSPSRYGTFEQPHLRHMMAEQAATVTVFYTEAAAKPRKHLPRLYKLTDSSCRRAAAEQLSTERCNRFINAGAAFLEMASEKHEKWNGTTWTRARHLFGLLCLEERRAAFATELLELMGHGDALKALRGEAQPAAPGDAIGRLLHRKLRAFHANGSLSRELVRWGLCAAAVVQELLLLATAAPRKTEIDPVLNSTETPLLFTKFISMLFVGFAHNLLLESYVSRLAQLEKIHPGMHPLTLHKLFMYRALGARERALRLDPSMRSTRGGGCRALAVAKALACKPLKGSASRSKSQMALLCEQVEMRASKYAAALTLTLILTLTLTLHVTLAPTPTKPHPHPHPQPQPQPQP
jgi:hypothetical protein